MKNRVGQVWEVGNFLYVVVAQPVLSEHGLFARHAVYNLVLSEHDMLYERLDDPTAWTGQPGFMRVA